ncbi:type IV secretion system DNA-binding domain-containing protein [bacterium]|nr:type IV secretion system DNA-binding domain-containing protein [bacterium]
MENQGITILGETNYRNQRKRFGIKDHDRQRHVYVVGQTGMGKSTLLLNMLVQDIQRGKGVALIDPHGDLAEQLLDHIPQRRMTDVIYINPADTEYPVGINLLDGDKFAGRHLIASHLVDIFKKIWSDSWGPRLEYILRNTILALLECGGHTLLSIPRLLIDPEFRAVVLSWVQDPVVRTFWQVEYELYPKVFRTETISPIQNKVGQFLSVPVMRNILGQPQNKVDFRAAMDLGRILIVNLAKGRLGEDNTGLLGSLIVSKLFLTAMSRSDTLQAKRKPFTVFIDEFQSFASENFAHTLSEMRKFGLHLVLAHQYLAQLPLQLKSAVFGNVGTTIAFRIGAEDGEYLEREYWPTFRASDLQSLSAYDIYVKLSIDGKTTDAFSARTLPEPVLYESHRDAIVQLTRIRYGEEKPTVEQRINSWMADPLHSFMKPTK